MNNTAFINSIKTVLVIMGFCFTTYSMLAQSSNTEYFMQSSFTNSFTNPAKRPEKGYIGIPGFTNLFVDLKTNTLNLDHFLFPGVGEDGKTGWFLNENVSYDDFMKNIAQKNYLGSNIDYTIFGAGFYLKDLFLSLDISARTNVGVNIPKGLFDFVKSSFTTGENEEKTYDLSNLSVNANAFTQLGLGGSYPVLNKSLVLGAKIKILFGIAHVNFNLDNMNININNNVWSVSTLASGEMLIPAIQTEYDETGKLSKFNSDGLFSLFNGSGLGLDLGATFAPGKIFSDAWLKPLTVSAAVTDIGFITWNKSKITSLATHPTDVIVAGNYNIRVDESYNIFKDVGDALSEAVAFYPSATSKTTSGIGAKMNWGVEYAFLNNRLNTGFLNTLYFNPVKTISEFTIAGAFRPASAVEAGLSYSFVHGNFQTVGLALHLGPCFYVSSDYAFPHVNSSFIPTTSQGLNFQVGVAVPIGKKHVAK